VVVLAQLVQEAEDWLQVGWKHGNPPTVAVSCEDVGAMDRPVLA
jgi:hypothetical protein